MGSINHQRRSIRLKGYDYSQEGAYFVTICTQNRHHLFGEIIDGKMVLNNAGKMVENEWLKLSTRFTNIKLHEFIVMPNHFHAILEIVPVGATLVVAQTKKTAQNKKINNIKNGQPLNGRPSGDGMPQGGQPQGIAPTGTGTGTGTKTIGDMVGAFESIVTVKYIRGVKNNNWKPFNKKLWQRNYYEHIIRNENEYNRIAQYIHNNPVKWENDRLNNKNIVMESQEDYAIESWMV